MKQRDSVTDSSPKATWGQQAVGVATLRERAVLSPQPGGEGNDTARPELTGGPQGTKWSHVSSQLGGHLAAKPQALGRHSGQAAP